MIFEKIQSILAEQFSTQPETISMETSLVDDLEADSLDLVELIMTVEDEFGLPEIDEQEAAGLTTVADIVNYIAARVDD